MTTDRVRVTGRVGFRDGHREIRPARRIRWRGRRVMLYPGDSPDMLYMIGKPLDGSAEVVVTHERIGLDEMIALNYWAHGEKVLVRE